MIKTESQKNFVVITVKDNGIGVDPDNQHTVFAKYERVDKAVEGSGIGLYLVNEIVTSGGGKIILKSELGKGAEFQVYLPTQTKTSRPMAALADSV